MTVVSTSHICLDNEGIAYVDGTTTRVEMLVMDTRNGMSPEQIRGSYGYLSLAQIHAALAYYYDHQDELDRQIAAEVREVAEKRRAAISAGTQPSREALEARRSGNQS